MLRLVWVFVARYALVRPGPDPVTGSVPPWQYTFILGWAGMRGVVTLAAAFVIPEDVEHREVLLLIAFTVVAGTLFIQGLSLPWVARRLRVPSPDPLEDALARAALLQQASKAGFVALHELEHDDPHGVYDLIRQRVDQRNFAAWERLSTTPGQESPSDLYARARLVMIDAERQKVLEIRSTGTVPSDVVREVLGILDVEESMLDIGRRRRARSPARGPGGDRELLRPPRLGRPRGRDVRRGRARVPAVRRAGFALGLASPVPDLRQHRVLRLLAAQARDRALPRHLAPGHAVGPARRGLALVLRPPPHRLSRPARQACETRRPTEVERRVAVRVDRIERELIRPARGGPSRPTCVCGSLASPPFICEIS